MFLYKFKIFYKNDNLNNKAQIEKVKENLFIIAFKIKTDSGTYEIGISTSEK